MEEFNLIKIWQDNWHKIYLSIRFQDKQEESDSSGFTVSCEKDINSRIGWVCAKNDIIKVITEENLKEWIKINNDYGDV